MNERLLRFGRIFSDWATETPRRATILRYVLPLGLVAIVFAVIQEAPVEGPVGGTIAIACVAACSWFCGPGPALLIPTVIWLVIHLDEPGLPAVLIPSAKQFATYFSLSLLTGAMGMAGQSRRRLRAETDRHAARLREYIQALSRAHIIFRDLDGRITAWNEGAEQLYGWTSAEATGRLIHELLQSRMPAPLSEIRNRLVSAGQWTGEISQRRKNGAELTVAVHCIRYAGEEGQAGSVAEIHNDVTELRRIEAALRESDHRKDLFVATLAHELRNPLAPLRSGLDVLKLTHSGTNETDAIVDIMERQLVHVVRMVEDLLDVSRINTGKIELRCAPVLLSDIVRDSVEACRAQIAEAQLDLQIAIPEQPVTLDADEARLVQVLVNLLSNAAKFTPAGGCIRLTAEHTERQVTIRVEDTGIGVSADALSHVFDVFAQVAQTRHRVVGGLGLGLHLVRTFVELHGGSVAAHSEGPGRGAEFVIRLPTTNVAELRAAPVPRSDRHVSPHDKQRVLVVDDNQDAARTLTLLLNKIGFDCRSAFDGPSALSLADEFDPQAIVLDLGMPGMDGLQVARRLRAPPCPSSALLIALTGWDKDEDRRNTREAGFDHHLAKPVQLDTLQKLLHSLEERSAAAG